MLFALLGGHVDGTVTHQYQPPRAHEKQQEQQQEQEQQEQKQQQEQEQGSRSRVPSQTPHLLYPQLLTKSQPQSAASQDTPLQTPEQSQVVIPPDQQQDIPSQLHVSQTASLQVNHHGHAHEHGHEHGHPGPEMFASAPSSSLSTMQTGNRPVSQSSAWMLPVMDSNNGPIVLPLAPPVPTSTPFDGFVSMPSMDFGNPVGGGGVGVGGMTNDLGIMGMSLPGDFASAPAPAPPAPVSAAGPGAAAAAAGDKGRMGAMTIMDNPPGLWEKLQAFYEPSVPLFWEGNNVGCVGDVNPGLASGVGGMAMYGGYMRGGGAGGMGMGGEGGYGMGVAIGDGVSGGTGTGTGTGTGAGTMMEGMNGGGGFGYPSQGTF